MNGDFCLCIRMPKVSVLLNVSMFFVYAVRSHIRIFAHVNGMDLFIYTHISAVFFLGKGVRREEECEKVRMGERGGAQLFTIRMISFSCDPP